MSHPAVGPDGWSAIVGARPAAGPTSARRRRLRRRRGSVTRVLLPQLLAFGALALLPAAGVSLIAQAYVAAPTSRDNSYFLVFWLGMALGYVPPIVLMTIRRNSRGLRQLAVAALGLFSFVPKYLRNSEGPLYFDEWAHWTQINDVVREGHLYLPSDQVPIIQYYPGLHTLAASLVQVTGVSSWTMGVCVIAAAHVLAGIAAFLIAETMLSSRAAGVAAAVYMSNAAWVYFDSQMAYESLGVTFVLWTLYFAARLYQARVVADRLRWAVLMTLCGLVCLLTHHLSTYLLTGILFICLFVLMLGSVVVSLRARRAQGFEVAWLVLPSAVVSVSLAAYIRLVAPSTSQYLGSSGVSAVLQLFDLLSGLGGSSGAGRTPFGGSQSPAYERYAAYLAPVIVALVIAVHLFTSKGFTADHRRGLAMPMAWIASGYVASLPLVLTASGSETARRSWAFTYLGVAIVVATVVGRSWIRRRRLTGVLLALGLPVLVVGNLAAGQNVPYRFPGPYIYGSDTRSLTRNMEAAATWWGQVRTPGSGVVAERFNGVLYQSQPDATLATSQLGPVWDFMLQPTPILDQFARDLAYNRFDYVVIDKRITTALPLIGSYFSTDDPAEKRTAPVDRAVIERWLSSPYTTRVYDSSQITLYRLDARYVAQQPDLRGTTARNGAGTGATP